MSKGAGLQVGAGLPDDRVGAVGLLGLGHGQRGVGEHAVVTVAGEQLTLLMRHGFGVQAPDPRTINRPLMWSAWQRDVNAVNATSATSASETRRCSSSSQIAFRVVDRGPCRLLDPRDRFNDSAIHPCGDREPGAARRAAAMTSCP